MDTNNCRLNQAGGEPTTMDSVDWRTQLHSDSRQRIVDKIMETLKRRLAFSGHEALQELKKIAVRFEEKMYTIATSQSDYLWKISVKMLTIEAESQNTMPNSMQSNSAAVEKPMTEEKPSLPEEKKAKPTTGPPKAAPAKPKATTDKKAAGTKRKAEEVSEKKAPAAVKPTKKEEGNTC